VNPATDRQTSSHPHSGGECAEVAEGAATLVRDSRNRDLGVPDVSPGAWVVFVAGLDRLRHRGGGPVSLQGTTGGSSVKGMPGRVRGREHGAMSISQLPWPSKALLVGGAAVFAGAYGWLLATGHTAVTASSDPGASATPLVAVVVPVAAAMLLARLVAPRAEVPLPLADLDRTRLRRETLAVLAAVVLFPAAVVAVGNGPWYALLKVAILLLVPLAAFRLLRGGGPRSRAVPAPVTWLAPLPAVLAWLLLSQFGPLATPLTQELPGPVLLAVMSLVTALTAGVLEEVVYRGWLQTRLEVLVGRWPAILASSLLFAAMHTSHLLDGDPALGLATIIAFQGVFGLMQGYLWARYRNIWALIAIHVAVNLVYLDLLNGALFG
jgi:membrane protease YdiL (CAAX protease family)